jgi:hypothetical protein
MMKRLLQWTMIRIAPMTAVRKRMRMTTSSSTKFRNNGRITMGLATSM